jgi:Protein of unknown function (DUF3168)
MNDSPAANQLVIEESLVAYLASVGPVRDLIGDRIYPEVAPVKASFPFLVYTVITDQDELTIAEAAGSPVATIQLDCWGEGGKQGALKAKRLYRAIRDALHGFGPGVMGSHWVDRVQVTDRSDQGENPQAGRERGDSRVMMQISIAYDDTAPDPVEGQLTTDDGEALTEG